MKKGKVIKLYPFLAIIDSLLKNEKTLLRCGAGHSGYAISTTGKLVACPIMNCIVNFEAGNLDSNPNELKKFKVTGKCVTCNVKDLCGGRCLYWNQAELWPEKGNDLICDTIKHYILELKAKLPEIQALIKKGIISKNDFEYEKYFGPEIIP
jgi:radical SAM protein with 4Fe4S-binding SPASM domain